MSGARRPWSISRVREALSRRRHGPYPILEELARQLESLDGRAAAIEARLEQLGSRQGAFEGDLHEALRALGAGEDRNRDLLRALRESPDYRLAWSEAAPLISVTVATIGRPELISRSLPSILEQGYGELEVIVAGDGAPPETAAALAALGDERVRYLDLGPRAAWTDDPVRLWLVGATRARNAAVGAARGRWVVEFDDDDAMRPGCLAALLELARESEAEAVYGQVRQHMGEDSWELCEFPPRNGRFCWVAGMYHAGLGFFGRQLLAADLGLPGDWWLAERMLRAGVRFAMRDEVLCDAYASDRARALERAHLPWRDDGLPPGASQD